MWLASILGWASKKNTVLIQCPAQNEPRNFQRCKQPPSHARLFSPGWGRRRCICTVQDYWQQTAALERKMEKELHIILSNNEYKISTKPQSCNDSHSNACVFLTEKECMLHVFVCVMCVCVYTCVHVSVCVCPNTLQSSKLCSSNWNCVGLYEVRDVRCNQIPVIIEIYRALSETQSALQLKEKRATHNIFSLKSVA